MFRTAGVALLIVGTISLLASGSLLCAAEPEPAELVPAQHELVVLRGRVIFLAEALQKRFGVTTVPEARERILALADTEGILHPLVEDTRGRGFRSDERLRNVELELWARRHKGSPLLQVIRVFAVKPDGRYELDYWCEICAIAMFELKECDCCQGPIELRERKVPADFAPSE